MSLNPYWLTVAKSFVGEFHAKGGNPHPALKEFVHLVDDFAHLSDENWGAAFVGASLALAGFHSSHSLNPSSYAYFGRKIATPLKGCIVLFNAMPEPHKAGHVAFFEKIEGDKIFVFGGNEPLFVSEKTFPLNKVKGYFYPNAVSLLPEPRPMNLHTIDSITDDLPPHLHEELIDNTQINFNSAVQYQGDYGGIEVDNKELWSLISGDGLPKPIAEIVYTTAEKIGHYRASLLLQEALASQGYNLLKDGNINQYTLLACQRVNIDQLNLDYTELSRNNYLQYLEPKQSEPVIEQPQTLHMQTNENISSAELKALIVETINANIVSKQVQTTPVEQKSASNTPYLTAIDKVFGGEYLKGKKTMLAVVVIVFNELLALFDVYPTTSNVYSVVLYISIGVFTIGMLSKLDRAIEARKPIK